MSFEAYKSATALAERAMDAGQDTQMLELSLFALSVIGDGDFGLASSVACEALDEVEARVSRRLSPAMAQQEVTGDGD